uniref:Vomeronasal type-1 receptor n=1 Tax=Nannospalax galili TaxID=1026970 RepID=A0A4Y1N475_NANGA|nr:vomeronasal type 1 receptor 3 [Nannospalax galili]AWV49308.1 vomeronasal type 1 receptor 3 [Nannospalax galili]AWV49319.1 vomeronasal type 1 receptor 3 [Nannospalax galili]AWV49323.1 vomeronasal type 1 receptor 3 [Nannospalax galili]AWV49327.1 vomeronasal type 1 receptor 3 [Nannospalax galili]
MNDSVDSRNLAIGIIILSQSTVGVLGNLSLLSYYVIRCYSECTLKPTDWILTHLIIANSLTILSGGILHTMALFKLKQFFNNFECKLILYVHRLGRCVSVGTTCLLSVFQATIISPRNSCCKNLKAKVPKYTGLCIFFCWVLYMVVNSIFPVYLYSKLNRNNLTIESVFHHCGIIDRSEITGSLYTAFIVIPEVLFSFLMAWSSSSMVLFLHRHKEQTKHIHSSNVSHRKSPESRATQNILALVSTFLTFYTLSSVLQGFIALLSDPSWWLVNIPAIISLCFPTLSPFIVSRASTVPKFCFSWMRN